MDEMESEWQFHNFKNLYSIVMMAFVDSKYRFIWVRIPWEFPWCSCSDLKVDQIVQLTSIKSKDTTHCKGNGWIKYFTIISWWWRIPLPYVAYGAIQYCSFNTTATVLQLPPEPCPYGYGGSIWTVRGKRILLRKCESKPENVKVFTLAWVVLHNLCISRHVVAPRQWDLTKDPSSNKQRDASEVRKLLLMRNCRTVTDYNRNATKIREKLKEKFWHEKQSSKTVIIV